MKGKMNTLGKVLLLLVINAVWISHTTFAEDNKNSQEDKSSIIKKRVEGSYLDVVQSIRSAILGKGINIAHELHASDMLQRTAPAFGYSNPIYSNAEILEFCSAGLSQKLSRIDPDNIVMCPFTIGVYSLSKEPNIVYITYQVPRGKPGTEEVTKEIQALIGDIVEDATW